MSNISYAQWDGRQVIIKLRSGTTMKCSSSNITIGGHEVLSCNVSGDEVQVLTKTKGSSGRATRMTIINKSESSFTKKYIGYLIHSCESLHNSFLFHYKYYLIIANI
jgi:predicted SPOUT superfamily RNA methylase MTH1